MFTGKFIDVPALIIESMLMARDGGRTTVNPHGLVLPRSITAILRRLRYKFLATEQKEEAEDVFNYNRVKKSLLSLAVGAKLMEPVKGKRRVAQERRDEMQEDTEEPSVPHPTEPRYQTPPQNEWETFSRTQNEWMQGVDTRLQGFGTMMEGMQNLMVGLAPTMQGMGSAMQGMDTRLQGVEARVDGLQGQMDDYTFRQHEMYMMQRNVIYRQYGEEEAHTIYREAADYADSEPPRRRRQRPDGRGGPMD